MHSSAYVSLTVAYLRLPLLFRAAVSQMPILFGRSIADNIAAGAGLELNPVLCGE